MFLTVHSSIGIIIGQHTQSAWLAFILGFIIHFIVDIIPHGDGSLVENGQIKTEKEVELVAKIGLVDSIVMTCLILFLVNQNIISLTWPIFFGIIGSICPDFITGFYLLFKYKWLKWYVDFHLNLHYIFKKYDVSLKVGLITQSLFLIIILLIII